MGDKAGAIKAIVGVMLLYTFIAIGISEIYKDESQVDFLQSEDNIAKWTYGQHENLKLVSDDALFGMGAFINGLWGILSGLWAMLTMMFSIAAFSDPRIPYFLYLFVIIPADVTLVLAIATLWLP